MHAIAIKEFGGPEVLEPAEFPDPVAGEGQTLIEVTAAGVNYADTHQTENTYLVPTSLPLVPGVEVAGRTTDGRRVVALLAEGGYAEKALAYDGLYWEVPDAVTDWQALSIALQGSTAWHLLKSSAHLEPGETVVVHAAAGGVGTLAIQLAKLWGAGRVIAAASTEEKRSLALELGADVAIDSREEDLKAALEEANEGKKLDIVLEMAGGTTFDQSLAALAPFGRLVTYGMASREAPELVNPAVLLRRSRAVIGFWLAHCFGVPGMLDRAMTDLLDMVAKGELKPILGGEYPLAEAADAHRALRSRETTGKLILTTG